ncbi:hypothetical protein GCM10009785_03170 [Brooklawnia cerclae]|uniref:ABC-type transport system substrate-binding protein n=1 Tax=Brooklawnia cerclae TaxID=349934 RepID=A0ABX0SCH0_9ACTN|nr:nuclear transport factor 2 family protein [Brooklawnia cerclae]NIH56089.1 ABC-type transport system substrate-binding protein [Brooklawnia cerclae]
MNLLKPVTVAASISLLAACGAAPAATPSSDPSATATVLSQSAESSPVAPSPTEPANAAESDQEALRTAAQTYSDAYLTGDGDSAYSLLSARCQARIEISEFASMVDMAKSMYGSALPFTSFSADISGDMARVTYTFSVQAINQTDEPWVKEEGTWHEDDC